MSEDDTLDVNDPQIKELIENEVAKATSGLISNRDDILREKKEIESKLKGVDLEEYNRLKQIQDDLENNKLKDSGNYEELIEKEKSRMRQDYETRLSEIENNLKSATTEAQQYQQELKNRTIADTLRGEAVKAGVLPEAVDDVIAKGLGVFDLSHTGEVDARNADGELLKDADDFILTPQRFIQGLKKSHQYYWGQSEGAGLKGSGNFKRGDVNTKLSEAAAAGDMEAFRKLRAKK